MKRIPKKFEGQDPKQHSDLFTDENPIGTVKGLHFRNEKDAKSSILRLSRLVRTGQIKYAQASQITDTFIQRAKFHYNQTADIRAGMKVWEAFKLRGLKTLR